MKRPGRKNGKSHYWRGVVCSGCFRSCRYRDFRAFGKDGFREVLRGLWKDNADPKTWRYKRRGTILGIMHEAKLEQWDWMTSNCPHWGEKEDRCSSASS